MFPCNYEYVLNLGTGLKVLEVLIQIEMAKNTVFNVALAICLVI